MSDIIFMNKILILSIMCYKKVGH